MTLPNTPVTLRERQKGLGRRLIAEATSRVILRSGIHQFSMQDVADEAGVSLRTLYRYFPSRQDLLDGVAAIIDEATSELGFSTRSEPLTAESLPTINATAFRMAAQNPDLGRAWVVINMITGTRSASMRERDEVIRQVVKDIGPHLTPTELDLAFGVIRYLVGSIAWKVMTDNLGMDTEEAARATDWALRVLLETIQAGGGPVDPVDPT